jgi:hypothetical protein
MKDKLFKEKTIFYFIFLLDKYLKREREIKKKKKINFKLFLFSSVFPMYWNWLNQLFILLKIIHSIGLQEYRDVLC